MIDFKCTLYTIFFSKCKKITPNLVKISPWLKPSMVSFVENKVRMKKKIRLYLAIQVFLVLLITVGVLFMLNIMNII